VLSKAIAVFISLSVAAAVAVVAPEHATKIFIFTISLVLFNGGLSTVKFLAAVYSS
jgi:hypothetical protein